MDTQLRKSRYNIGFKIIAWALSIAGMCCAAWAVMSLVRLEWNGIQTQYTESSAFYSRMQGDIAEVYGAFYLDESSMQEELAGQLQVLEAEREEKLAALYDTSSGQDTLNADTSQVIDAINQLYDSRVADAENTVRQNYAREQAMKQAGLANREDLKYVVTENGAVVRTNVAGDNVLETIEALASCIQQTYYMREDGSSDQTNDNAAAGTELNAATGATGVGTPAPSEGQEATTAEKEITVYAAMPESVFIAAEEQYRVNAAQGESLIIWMVCGFLVFAAGLIWLMVLAGRTPTSAEVQVGWSDAIPLDIGFVLMCIIEGVCIAGIVSIEIFDNTLLMLAILSLMVAPGVVAFNMWITSFGKRIRRGEAGTHTICYMIGSNVARAFNESDIRARVFWLVFALILLCMFGAGIFASGLYGQSNGAVVIGLVLLVLTGILSMWSILKKAASVKKISDGLHRIMDGDLDFVITPEGGPELEAIANGINHIAEGFQSAVGKEVRSERMKTELISNISHDLKTPLTSILAYIDLLKKENLQGENAVNYLEVLDVKSQRLKVLTEDLFEAAKAASGDIAVSMSKIELVQFMQQVLGEMGDKIEKSGLIFINDIPDDKMYVCADGKLLWRVIGNVLDNVLKYAMDGSRVYVDIKKTLKAVNITVKNVSRDPLNIKAEELMERSVRGDASRHTEGSGLGLSIAKNLMQIMGCGFAIEIDGDLFKVVMTLNEA